MYLASRGNLSWVLLALLAGAGVVRAADQPPAVLYSGKALNDLLLKCQGRRPPPSPEPPRSLPARARGAGNILTPGGMDTSVYRKSVSSRWPPVLREASKERKRFTAALDAVVKAADKGKVPARLVKELQATTAALDTILAKQADEITPSQYIESKRFLNRLNSAVKTLNPATLGADLALAERIARARTTAGLVALMTARKLQFAPALPGEEAAYHELYGALAAYHRSLGP
jgi:hypothetical protein